MNSSFSVHVEGSQSPESVLEIWLCCLARGVELFFKNLVPLVRARVRAKHMNVQSQMCQIELFEVSNPKDRSMDWIFV